MGADSCYVLVLPDTGLYQADWQLEAVFK